MGVNKGILNFYNPYCAVPDLIFFFVGMPLQEYIFNFQMLCAVFTCFVALLQ
jgi:hypothetical protein